MSSTRNIASSSGTWSRRALRLGVWVGVLGIPLAMAPWGYSPFGPIKYLALCLAATLITLSVFGSPLADPKVLGRLVRSPVFLAMAFYFVALAVGVVLSPEPGVSLLGRYPDYQGLLVYLMYGVVGLGAASLLRDERERERLVVGVAVAVALVSFYALLQFFGADFMKYQASEFALQRPGSTLGNASNLGVWLCFILPVVLYSASIASSRFWMMIQLAVSGAGFAVLTLTLSRGAWLGALVAVLIAGAWMLKVAKNRRVPLTFAGLVSVTVIVIAATQWTRIAYRFRNAFAAEGTFTWRASVWRDTITLITERTLLGRGPASFRYVFGQYRGAETFFGRPLSQAIDDPHNLVLSSAVSGGIVAAIALVMSCALSMWALVARGFRRREAWATAVASGLAGGFVALQAHFITLDTGSIFFMMIFTGGLIWYENQSFENVGRGTDTKPSLKRSPFTRIVGVLLIGVFAFGMFTAFGAQISDASLARAFTLESQDEPWQRVSSSLERAAAFSPWDHMFEWAWGRVALDRITKTSSDDAYQEGAEHYGIAMDASPYDPRIFAEAGDFFLTRALQTREPETFEQARDCFDRAIELEPEGPAAWIGLAAANAGLGDWYEAVRVGTRATELAPDNMSAWNNLAIYLEQVGDIEGAAEAQAQADRLQGE